MKGKINLSVGFRGREEVGAPLNGVQIFGRKVEERSYPNLVGHANGVASLFPLFVVEYRVD